MNCETTRELLALRLYDELERDEGARLDAHLADCAACRAKADELEQGLGRLAAASELAPLPAAPTPRFHGWQVAAAFAAGLAVSWFLVPSGALPKSASAPAAASFRRADPPPPASGEGRLAPLGAWLRR
jgi:hypothetical protein